MTILKKIKTKYLDKQPVRMTIDEYLKACKKDSSLYLNPQERLLKAIGDPKVIDTRKDARLGRIFSNRTIKLYKGFEDFYGLEDTIDQIVSFLKHAARGLEERKQVLYLLGPVGGGKSSLAERIKKLMESEPFYAIEGSPIFESPLGFFDESDAEDLGIPARYLTQAPSPWALKRFKEFGGDLSKFNVVKLFPSQLYQTAISKTEPGDENNQDISSLVGKLDIRKLDEFSQDDPDAYSFSGGLCLGNRGIMEFMEMFKAPIKTLNPLLGATQEGNYNGTEAISGIPFEGLILAHSNESEWAKFRNNKQNEALLDRISLIRVPYTLRVSEEAKIYEKLLKNSSIDLTKIAPKTLDYMAEFNILTRLKDCKNSAKDTKMKVYDGENLKNRVEAVKSVYEYKQDAGPDEGFTGMSTRFAYKVLSHVFDYDPRECAANPVHLFTVLKNRIVDEQLPEDVTTQYKKYIKYIAQDYLKFLERDIKKAYLESYSEYGQNVFNKYIAYASAWLDDEDYRDEDTGGIISPVNLESFLEEIEKPSKIVNSKDFRNEVVKFCLKYQAAHKGENVKWSSYEKMREVIEKKIFNRTEDLLPIISFGAKGSAKEKKKHTEFVQRMMDNGYTENQVRTVVDWYIQSSKT